MTTPTQVPVEKLAHDKRMKHVEEAKTNWSTVNCVDEDPALYRAYSARQEAHTLRIQRARDAMFVVLLIVVTIAIACAGYALGAVHGQSFGGVQ